MDLKEEWDRLKGHTKMMILGGGGLALFFLYTAIKNRNQGQQQAQVSSQSSTQAPDLSSALDQMTQNFQDLQSQTQQQIQADQQQVQQLQQANQQSLQQFQQANQQSVQSLQSIIQQNQQQVQSQISALTSKMATPVKKIITSKPPAPVKSTPVPKTSSIVYKAFGNDYYNSSIWGLSKMYLMHHGGTNGKGISDPTNAQIQTEVNHVVKVNNVKNPSKIQKGQMFKMN